MSVITHTDKALIALRQRILRGAYPGGARLFEVALAQDLRISRTPVRAALAKLAEEGLLDRSPGGGFAVRRFDMADVLDTIDLRGVLEGTAARFAAERGVPPDLMDAAQAVIARIDAILAVQDYDLAQYSDCNRAFHDLLAQMSGSPVLEREIQRITALPFASPTAFLEDSANATRIRQNLLYAQNQHRQLIEAIAQREGARAEALAREHARAARRNAEDLMANRTASRDAASDLAILSQ